MSTETNVNSLIINKMSETKYSQITPIEGQMYATPDTHIATKEWTESRINDIMNNLYPVGSTYITTASTCPLATLISGSTWALVSSGRVLQGADSGHAAGTTIEAGLPNITGNIYGCESNTGHQGADGAFVISGYTGGGEQNGNGTWVNFNLDASRSSGIYGKSSTVQPPAYVVNIFQRTA